MAGALSVPVTTSASSLLLPTKKQSSTVISRCTALSNYTVNACSTEAASDQEGILVVGFCDKLTIANWDLDEPFVSSLTISDIGCLQRRPLLLGVGALATNLFPASSVFAKDGLDNYQLYVDSLDGYSYYYPSDWADFEYRGHDSSFKDRYLSMQNVRLHFKPTDKKDIHELGPMKEVIYNLVNHIYSAPTQRTTIFDMQERTIDGRNYYTFEYDLTSTNFSRTAFATISIGNGRCYTLIVGALGRRWKKVRNQLKVVADSFKVFDI